LFVRSLGMCPSPLPTRFVAPFMMMRNALVLPLTLILTAHLGVYAANHARAADQKQAAQHYELSRGAGEKRSECVGLIRVGPTIALEDLEATRTHSYGAKISLRGTKDSVICENILHPAMQKFLKDSAVRFHNGMTVPLAQVFGQILEAGKQPRIPQTSTSTALDRIPVHALHAVVVYEGTAIRPDPHPIDTPQGIIHIKVEHTHGPITLFLMSYDPVDWRVSATDDAHIESVILRGYSRQTIQGLSKTVPINIVSLEDDGPEQMMPPFSRTLVTSRDGLIEFKSYVRAMVGVEPVTVQSMYTGHSIVIDGKTTLAYPAPIERPITQPVVFTSENESSARFHGRKMISPDRLTVGYGMSGASTESIASVPHSRGKWYAEFMVHVGSDNAVSDTWTNVGIRSTANEQGGLVPHEGQLSYGVKRYLTNSGGLRDKDVIGLAMDLTQGHLYVRHNGAWVGGSPEGGNPIIHITNDREYVVAVDVGSPGQDYSKTDTWTGNFGSTPFHDPLPEGFEPYGGRRPTQ
jgi:hypothetical protein